MAEATFPSLTAEAKYRILNFLSENRDDSHSCFEITQTVQQKNEAIREISISGALHTLWISERIMKPSRGMYQINGNYSSNLSPQLFSTFPDAICEGHEEQNTP